MPATLLKVTLLHGRFLGFLNCTNGTKLCKASHVFSKFVFESTHSHFVVKIH